MSQIATLGTTPIFKLPLPPGFGAAAVVFFRACLHCDVDGSLDAYGPHNSGTDYTANAGEPNHWWALVCEHGQPIIRDGFYVSTTSLQDPAFPVDDRRRYVDAKANPYIVLPVAHYAGWGIRAGDLAWVQKLDADGNVVATSPAIFADAGPNVGEGSYALLDALHINPDPRHGGIDEARVQFFVFCGSGNGRPQTLDAITAGVHALLPTLQSLTGLAAPIKA